VIGDTGVGKTLFGLDATADIAAGKQFLNWDASEGPCRAMYIDGEMPEHTFDGRLRMVRRRVGEGVKLYAYNRDFMRRIGEDISPLDTEDGLRWLMREIEAVKPSFITFDSIMYLTVGAMAEDKPWKPTSDLINRITGLQIGQMWLHHTGHDAMRGFGTKTREWGMDLVVRLDRNGRATEDSVESDPIALRFLKTRHKTPETRDDYRDIEIVYGPGGWRVIGPAKSEGERKPSDVQVLKHAIGDIYDRLADTVEPSGAINGYKLLKVKADRLREELKDSGYLDQDDGGRVTDAARKRYERTKRELLAAKDFREESGMIWRIRPSKRLRATLS
jgi:hypothetical protein